MARFTLPIRVYSEDTARLNDRLAVSVEALDRGASRLTVAQEVLRDTATLATARISLARVDPVRWRPARIPAPLARLLPSRRASTT